MTQQPVLGDAFRRCRKNMVEQQRRIYEAARMIRKRWSAFFVPEHSWDICLATVPKNLSQDKAVVLPQRAIMVHHVLPASVQPLPCSFAK